jgi:predicted ribosomally synthesized peptide with nif11-like leader
MIRLLSRKVELMSVADLKKYGQMIQEVPKVRQRAKEIGIADLDNQIAHAKDLGLEFNKDDLQALADEAGITKGELSEEQLEQIAGGCASVTCVAAGLVMGVGVGAAVGASASDVW